MCVYFNGKNRMAFLVEIHSMGKIEWHFSMAFLVENHSMGKIEWHFSMAYLVEIHSMCVFSMGNFRW